MTALRRDFSWCRTVFPQFSRYTCYASDAPVQYDNDNFLIFNAMENEARRVFLADMRKFR